MYAKIRKKLNPKIRSEQFVAKRRYPASERYFVTTRGWRIPADKNTTIISLLEMMRRFGVKLELRYNGHCREFVLFVRPEYVVPQKLIEMMSQGNFPEQRIKLYRPIIA